MPKNALGCKLSKIDLRDYKIKASSVIQFPEEYELEYTHYIKNQAGVSSCVAHSTSEILEYYNLKDKDIYTKLSTNFIYSIRHKLLGDYGPGMHLVDACKLVQKFGDMTDADCPGNIEAPKCFEQADELLKTGDKLDKAYYYRIDSYYKCNSDNDIKAAIMNYGPVLGAVKWYNTYKCNKSTAYKVEFNTEGSFGYHAIVIYGWTKDGWLIQNSWGKQFGNNGCAILPFKYGIAEARCLIDHDNKIDGIKQITPNAKASIGLDKTYILLNKVINFILRRK